MKKAIIFSLACIALLAGGCRKHPKLPSLKEIIFQKPDGTIYDFTITPTETGGSIVADANHDLVITTNYAKTSTGNPYLISIVVSNSHGNISYITATNAAKVPYNNQPVGTFSCHTDDTTKPFNLGNTNYNLYASPVYSFDTDPSVPINSYPSGYSDSSGVTIYTMAGIDTLRKCVYAFDRKGQDGDHYYVDYDSGLTMWVLRCAIGFAHSSFSDISSYMTRIHSVGLNTETYYENGVVTAVNNYTYSLNSGNYVVNWKQITDNNGKVSLITYKY